MIKLSTIEPGMTKILEEEVTEEKTAVALKSGSMRVYATPAMCALMERAAAELADENLDTKEFTTVGVKLDIVHVSPSPVGMKIRAEAKVLEIERKRITYAVKAYDEKGEIGSGVHIRYVVVKKKFEEDTYSKLY